MSYLKYPTPADIAEMKASGYCPSTIEPAIVRMRRWPEAQRLCGVIREAFSGVKLGGGVGLAEARALDDHADEATCAEARRDDEKDDWQRIPAGAINSDSTGFLDAEGLRFHLPAMMISEIMGEYHFGVPSELTHVDPNGRERLSLLSREQRRAVREFLLFAADDPDCFDPSEILRALEEYWVE